MNDDPVIPQAPAPAPAAPAAPAQVGAQPVGYFFVAASLVSAVTLNPSEEDRKKDPKLQPLNIGLAQNGSIGMFPVFTDVNAAAAYLNGDTTRILQVPFGVIGSPPPPAPAPEPSRIIRPRGVFGGGRKR